MLSALGTSGKEIIFTGGEAHDVEWQGIYFYNSLPGSQLVYCTIEDSINSGIRIDNSVPTIRNSKIRNNQGTRGGGIDVVNVGSFTLNNCVIDSNSVSVQNHNSVARGGGIYVAGDLTIIDSTISNNLAYGYASHNYWTVLQYAYGGGIYATGTTNLTNCYILNNTTNSNSYAPGPGGGAAYSFGGGIFFDGTLLDIKNCVVSDNTNPAAADAVTNREGAGIYVSSGTANLTNVTIARNLDQGLRNNNGAVTAINCIFWENSSSQISGDVTVTYSDVQGGYTGEGNINLNPIFASIDDYHIDCTISPCINAGSNAAPLLPDTDIDDKPRICNDAVDMGAYECCAGFNLIANAGPDKIICNQICGEVVLDGRKSQGDIVSYDWKLNHDDDLCDQTATGETPTVTNLCLGTYDVTLAVTDVALTETDQMNLTVIETCDPCAIMQGDFDSDGDVDGDDLRIFSGHFGSLILIP